MLVTVFALALRIFDISNFSVQESIAESSKDAAKVKTIKSYSTNKAKSNEGKHNPEAKENKAGESLKLPSYAKESYSSAEIKVLRQLSSRRGELDRREEIIKKKEALLKAAEQGVDKKIAELGKIKTQLEKLLKDQHAINEKRLNSLVKIYEGMKPKQASRIFDTLDMGILMQVIAKMSERKTSPILANMNPKKAREVTTNLANQYKLPE